MYYVVGVMRKVALPACFPFWLDPFSIHLDPFHSTVQYSKLFVPVACYDNWFKLVFGPFWAEQHVLNF